MRVPLIRIIVQLFSIRNEYFFFSHFPFGFFFFFSHPSHAWRVCALSVAFFYFSRSLAAVTVRFWLCYTFVVAKEDTEAKRNEIKLRRDIGEQQQAMTMTVVAMETTVAAAFICNFNDTCVLNVFVCVCLCVCASGWESVSRYCMRLAVCVVKKSLHNSTETETVCTVIEWNHSILCFMVMR